MSSGNEVVAAKTTSWRGQAVQLAAIVAVVFLAKGAIAEP
ncbi:signal peptidase I, partial [Klebsiella pneumoniae]|nr:signal peptidase I [Klebsiella pneumoniae]